MCSFFLSIEEIKKNIRKEYFRRYYPILQNNFFLPKKIHHSFPNLPLLLIFIFPSNEQTSDAGISLSFSLSLPCNQRDTASPRGFFHSPSSVERTVASPPRESRVKSRGSLALAGRGGGKRGKARHKIAFASQLTGVAAYTTPSSVCSFEGPATRAPPI